jgi:CRISPR-associated endonuclease/helicase Cas3
MSTMFSPLLAKGLRTPGSAARHETLRGHVCDVVAVMRVLVTEHAHSALQALGLAKADVDTFAGALIRAAFLHDLGKANSGFQAMVRKQAQTQPFRHEVLSLWLLHRHEEFRAWLFDGLHPEAEALATAAVLCHHLKASDLNGPRRPKPGSGMTVVECHWDHPDLYDTLLDFAGTLQLPAPPRLCGESLELSADPLASLRRRLMRVAGELEDLPQDQQRILALVKGLLIAADVAGSALPRNGRDAAWWTGEVLSRRCGESDYEQAAKTGARGHPYRPFQVAVSRSAERVTFIRAGCGNGKTTAAYLWAARYPECSRLYVSYPTTGTATEGFRDYVAANVPATLTACFTAGARFILKFCWRAVKRMRWCARSGWRRWSPGMLRW